MKNLSKVALLALIVAISFEACTKNNNTVTPKATTVNKAGSNTLLRKDTITPLFKRDTITPKLTTLSRDTITPKAAVRDTITPKL